MESDFKNTWMHTAAHSRKKPQTMIISIKKMPEPDRFLLFISTSSHLALSLAG